MAEKKNRSLVIRQNVLGALWTQIQDPDVNAAKAVHDFVLRPSTNSGRLEAARAILEAGQAFSESTGAVVSEAWTILFSEKLWKGTFISEEEAKEALDSAALDNIRRAHSQLRKRKDRAINIIRNNWRDSAAELDFGVLGETAVEVMAAVSKTLTYKEARHAIWHITIDRLEHNADGKGRGVTRKPGLKDWQSLRRMHHDKLTSLLSRKQLSNSELAKYKLSQDDLHIAPLLPGSISRAQRPHKRRVIDSDSETSCEERQPRRSSRIQKRQKTVGGDLSKEPEDSNLQPVEMSCSEGHTTSEDREEGEQYASDESSSEETGGSAMEEAMLSDDYGLESPDDLADRRDDECVDSGILEAAADSDSRRKCRCSSMVGEVILQQIGRKTQYQANMDTGYGQLMALAEFAEKDKSFKAYCRYHLAILGGKLGLQVRSLDKKALVVRLKAYWAHRADVRKFMDEDETQDWWRKGMRRPETEDHLGIYSYMPIEVPDACAISESRARSIAESIQRQSIAEFSRDGSIIFKGFFSFLWEGITVDGEHEQGIGALIDLEFDMYLHHLTERRGQPNYGWLRTMYHSLTQQIIRQDVGYWMIYAAMRPDRCYRLISYPYYTKYAEAGDHTAFRHLDLNVNRLLESGQGHEIIQGSISLDDEDQEGCTEMVLGFHRKIRGWWEKVKARKEDCDGMVTGLTKRYTKQDEQDFGSFQPFPCQRGDVRLSMPEIPHGSTGPQKSVRRTILPWYVAVQEDRETLDGPESDTYSELVTHYYNQTAPSTTPSGHPNMYGVPPFKFPASVHLPSESSVGNALVCRVSWWDPGVQAEAQLLLGADRQMAWQTVLRARKDALKQFKKKWDVVKQIEKAAYGSNSFFLKKQ